MMANNPIKSTSFRITIWGGHTVELVRSHTGRIGLIHRMPAGQDIAPNVDWFETHEYAAASEAYDKLCSDIQSQLDKGQHAFEVLHSSGLVERFNVAKAVQS